LRTDIEIDDQLLRQAMRSTGAKTKRAAVEAGCVSWCRPTPKLAFATSAAKWSGKEISTARVRIRSRISSGYNDRQFHRMDRVPQRTTNPHTERLDRELARRRLGLTDIILCEVLQGIQRD
jgi:hypothetical protein